jgi:hypothetical protein
VLLLVLACLLYVPAIAAIYGAPQGDPANYSGEDRFSVGWAEFFVMLFGIPLWVTLGGLLLSAGRSGSMPDWAKGPSAILHIAAAVAVWAVTLVYIDADGGVSVLVPALLPLLIALYAAALRLPGLASRLSPDRVCRIAFAAGAIVMAAAIPLGYLDEQNLSAHVAADAARFDAVIAKQQTDSAKARAEEEARFKALTPDSPLKDYLDYLLATSGGSAEHAAALAGARRVKTRQVDAIQLLDQGRIDRLQELWEFDLEAAPTLCAAYDRALQRLATSDEFDWNVGEHLENQLPNIKFLATGHCNLDAGLTAAQARINKIIAVNQGDERWTNFLATLATLHQKD